MNIYYKGEIIIKSWGAKKATYIVFSGPTFTSLKAAKAWITKVHNAQKAGQ